MSLLCRLKNLVHKGLLKKEDLDRIVIIPKEQENKVIKMRDATPEERESIAKYINDISKQTVVNFWDLEQELKYCDRNICIKNEYNGIGCDKCKVTKSQEPCDDCISRADIRHLVAEVNRKRLGYISTKAFKTLYNGIDELPPITPQPRTGHCKDCKYFEYDSVANIDGISLIVAHKICKRWGDGCMTSEDGYCFLFESKESEV